MNFFPVIFQMFLVISNALETPNSKIELSFKSIPNQEFITNFSEQWSVSSNCVDRKGKLKVCGASQAIAKVKVSSWKISGGVSETYTSLCQLTNGISLTGTDAGGSEARICQYSDDTMLFSNTLYAHFRKKRPDGKSSH